MTTVRAAVNQHGGINIVSFAVICLFTVCSLVLFYRQPRGTSWATETWLQARCSLLDPKAHTDNCVNVNRYPNGYPNKMHWRPNKEQVLSVLQLKPHQIALCLCQELESAWHGWTLKVQRWAKLTQHPLHHYLQHHYSGEPPGAHCCFPKQKVPLSHVLLHWESSILRSAGWLGLHRQYISVRSKDFSANARAVVHKRRDCFYCIVCISVQSARYCYRALHCYN